MTPEFRAGERTIDDVTRCSCGAANILIRAASGGLMYVCSDQDCEFYGEHVPPKSQSPTWWQGGPNDPDGV